MIALVTVLQRTSFLKANRERIASSLSGRNRSDPPGAEEELSVSQSGRGDGSLGFMAVRNTLRFLWTVSKFREEIWVVLASPLV